MISLKGPKDLLDANEGVPEDYSENMPSGGRTKIRIDQQNDRKFP